MTDFALFNAHTHHFSTHALINVNALNCEIPLDNASSTYLFSVGIHPWDTEKISVEKVPAILAQCFEKVNPMAIGECGVDRLRGAIIDVQLAVFEQHVRFATEKNLPVIVHSVRAISDILPIVQKYKNTLFVFHDYRGNWIQTETLLQLNCYFSFGISMLNPNEKLLEVIKKVPIHRLLLETDDEDPALLFSVYTAMATIRKMESEMLEMAIRENVDLVFFKKGRNE